VVGRGPPTTFDDEIDDVIDIEDEKACLQQHSSCICACYIINAVSSLFDAAPIPCQAGCCQGAIRPGSGMRITHTGVVLNINNMSSEMFIEYCNRPGR
jgi:hypothetical protein